MLTNAIEEFPSFKFEIDERKACYIRGCDLLYLPYMNNYSYQRHVISHEISHVKLLNYTWAGTIMYSLFSRYYKEIETIFQIITKDHSMPSDERINNLIKIARNSRIYTQSLDYVVEPIGILASLGVAMTSDKKLFSRIFDALMQKTKYKQICVLWGDWSLKILNLLYDGRINTRTAESFFYLPCFISLMFDRPNQIINSKEINLKQTRYFAFEDSSTSPKKRIEISLRVLEDLQPSQILEKDIKGVAKFIIEKHINSSNIKTKAWFLAISRWPIQLETIKCDAMNRLYQENLRFKKMIDKKNKEIFMYSQGLLNFPAYSYNLKQDHVLDISSIIHIILDDKRSPTIQVDMLEDGKIVIGGGLYALNQNTDLRAYDNYLKMCVLQTLYFLSLGNMFINKFEGCPMSQLPSYPKNCNECVFKICCKNIPICSD